jgi:hypothetical protein
MCLPSSSARVAATERSRHWAPGTLGPIFGGAYLVYIEVHQSWMWVIFFWSINLETCLRLKAEGLGLGSLRVFPGWLGAGEVESLDGQGSNPSVRGLMTLNKF